MTTPVRSTLEINDAYYRTLEPGRLDYWRFMAAPRYRVKTLLGRIAQGAHRSLIDLGCGSGELLTEIRERFPEMPICGIDLSPAQIEANRAKVPSIDWQTGNLGHPNAISKELAGRFDVVVAAEIIEHIAEPEVFLKNALALATPHTGRLILTTQSGPVSITEQRVGHVRHFTTGQMGRMLSAAGWTPISVWNTGWPFHDLSKWIANLTPDRTMRDYSSRPYGPVQRFICACLRLLFTVNSHCRGAQLFAVAQRM